MRRMIRLGTVGGTCPVVWRAMVAGLGEGLGLLKRDVVEARGRGDGESRGSVRPGSRNRVRSVRGICRRLVRSQGARIGRKIRLCAVFGALHDISHHRGGLGEPGSGAGE